MRRARPVLALAVVSFAAGAVLGIHHSAPPGNALADQFVTAWARREYTSMYSDLSASSRRSISLSQFVGDYEDALRVATATRLEVTGRARSAPGGAVRVPVRVYTRRFGSLALSFSVQIDGSRAGGPRRIQPQLAARRRRGRRARDRRADSSGTPWGTRRTGPAAAGDRRPE